MKFSLSSLVTFSLLAAATNVAHASFPQPQSLVEDNVKDLARVSTRRLKYNKNRKSRPCTSTHDDEEVGELKETITSLQDTNLFLEEQSVSQQQVIADLQARLRPAFVPAQIARDALEGSYIYLGCGQVYYFATIECSVENDICDYSENAIGNLVVTERDGQDATIDAISIGEPSDGIYVMPQDESDPCVFYGSFKLSTALLGNEMTSFPLKYSESCNVPAENKYVVKGYTTQIRNGPAALGEALRLLFSRDNGSTFYNKDHIYFAQKMTSEEVSAIQDERRSLVVYDEASLSTHGVVEYTHSHRELFLCGGACIGAVATLGSAFIGPILFPPAAAAVVAAPVIGVAGALAIAAGLLACAVTIVQPDFIFSDSSSSSDSSESSSDDSNNGCFNLHNDCDFWSNLYPSECEVNPGYMLEDCRRACGVCSF